MPGITSKPTPQTTALNSTLNTILSTQWTVPAFNDLPSIPEEALLFDLVTTDSDRHGAIGAVGARLLELGVQTHLCKTVPDATVEFMTVRTRASNLWSVAHAFR